MAIDKIGALNNYNEYNKVNRTNRLGKVSSADSINISKEASSMADNKRIMDIVNSAPDVRADKVAAMKAKMKDPNYINDRLVDSLADSIMDAFNL